MDMPTPFLLPIFSPLASRILRFFLKIKDLHLLA